MPDVGVRRPSPVHPWQGWVGDAPAQGREEEEEDVEHNGRRAAGPPEGWGEDKGSNKSQEWWWPGDGDAWKEAEWGYVGLGHKPWGWRGRQQDGGKPGLASDGVQELEGVVEA